MAGENLSAAEALERELQELRPTIRRRQRAEAMPPDPIFVRALRARLMGAPEAETLPVRLKRVIATLLAPPAPSAAPVGLRAAAGLPQPVTYATGDLQITLGMEQQGDTVMVRGMVYGEGPDPAGARVTVLRGEDLLDEAQIDEFGVFTLRAPAGTFMLRLSLGESEIEVPDLRLDA